MTHGGGPRVVELTDLSVTEAVAGVVAQALRPGDVVLLSGPLGAGKTTLTRAVGNALGVRPPVTSPTFVIARSHSGGPDGLRLVHVDAYRLESADALADLDLEAELDDAALMIEWGRDKAEFLNDERLELELVRDFPATTEAECDGEERRELLVTLVGGRWTQSSLLDDLARVVPGQGAHGAGQRADDGSVVGGGP